MKVSLNWIKQFTDVNLTVDELVTKIGAQLGAVEEVIDVGKKYEGILIVRVIECDDHPDADRLHVCMIDDGGTAQNVTRQQNGHIQVVCGAPNVRPGMLAVWIPPGVIVPSTADKDPFALGAREIRGVVSNGMLASASELAISDDHSGILEADIDLRPGTSFVDAYELDDHVIDIENKMFTHRPDLFGILGVAREIAGIQNLPFKSPEWYLQPLGRIKPGKITLPLQVRNEIPELAPRFAAIAMADVKVKPSPLIIQTYLSRVGLRPINNIVDMTNYLMVLTGQPLHAYDYDKVMIQDAGANVATLVVRKPQKGESLLLINGKTIEPDEGIMIATETKLVGVGGVMGGAGTEVDENTKNIIIECANFDMYSIRRTAMKFGLFTDAVTRFTKGQSAMQNEIVLEEAVATTQYVSGGHVASEVFDIKNNPAPFLPVHVTSDFVNSRLGLNLSAEDMATRLRNVELKAIVSADTLTVTPPFWRTDIEIPEDIVEEVGRLIGFDKLPVELPNRSIRPAKRNGLLEYKAAIRDNLSIAGANEVLTYSFVHGDLLDKVGQDKKLAFQLSNALSPDLQYYRLSLTPSLLERVHPNIKAGFGQFAIFEIGTSHRKDALDAGKLPLEFERLALVFAADDKTAREHYHGAPYYEAQYYLRHLSGDQVRFAPLKPGEYDSYIDKPFEPGRSASVYINDNLIGVVGEYRPDVARAVKLPQFSAGFEIEIEPLEAALGHRRYTPLSRFPSVQQDMTLAIDADVPFEQIQAFINTGAQQLAAGIAGRIQVTAKDIYQKKGAKHKNLTFGFRVASYERTLTDQEVNKLLDDIATKLREKFDARRI